MHSPHDQHSAKPRSPGHGPPKFCSVTTLAAQPLSHQGPFSAAPSSWAEIIASAGLGVTHGPFCCHHYSIQAPLFYPGATLEMHNPHGVARVGFPSQLSPLEGTQTSEMQSGAPSRRQEALLVDTFKRNSWAPDRTTEPRELLGASPALPRLPPSAMVWAHPVSPAHSQSLPNWTPEPASTQSDNVLAQIVHGSLSFWSSANPQPGFKAPGSPSSSFLRSAFAFLTHTLCCLHAGLSG